MEIAEAELTAAENDELALIAFQQDLTKNLAHFFYGDLTDDIKHNLDGALDTLQVTTNIAMLAAQAAVAVLIAFERGYRMDN